MVGETLTVVAQQKAGLAVLVHVNGCYKIYLQKKHLKVRTSRRKSHVWKTYMVMWSHGLVEPGYWPDYRNIDSFDIAVS